MMKQKWLYWCGLIMLVFLALPTQAWAQETVPTVAYRGHIQDLGDYPADGSWVDSPAIIGTVGQSKRIEGFEIKLTGTIPEGMELRYNVHVQNKGWLYVEDDVTDWLKDGAYAGTRGQGLRIEAVNLVLTDADGQVYPGYSVYYRGHVQNVGDLPADDSQWLADGAQLGTVGSSQRLEALLVQVVKTETDLSAYRALLKQVDETAATDYTVSSWSALETAMTDHVVTAEASQLTVNAAVTAIQAAFDGLVKKADPQVYDQAGTFGPADGSQTIAGDVTIVADGVVLNNLVIDGNLTISEAVGDGTVTLNNISVKGDTLVRGGGVNSIHINGGDYSRIIVEKTASGAVRIVALDAAGLEVVIAEDAAGQTIILEGAFASVTVDAPNMTVTTQGATTTIASLTVGAAAGGSTLNLAAGTTVGDLVLEGKATIKGQGTVARAEVKADGVVFEKKPAAYEVKPDLVVPPVFPSDGGGGGYTPPSPPPPVAVTGVSLPATLELGVNEIFQLSATLEPANASNQAVTFSSDSGYVQLLNFRNQTVDLYGNSTGTATITVTTADGGLTDTCAVTVRPQLRLLDSQLLAGTTDNYLCLSLTGDDLNDHTVWTVETNTTGLSLGTATKNADGTWRLPLIGQAKAGTLTLRASSLGYGIDSMPVTVTILAPTNSLAPVVVQDTIADFSFVAQTGASAVTLQQKLSTASDATWAPATLAASLNAQSTTARVTGLSPGISYEFRLLVVGGATPGASNRVGLTTRVPVTGISLDPAGPLTLKFGQRVTLTATVEPVNATDKTVSWSSSDPTILRSDGDGSFMAIGVGTANILANSSDAGSSATFCQVTVAAPTPIRDQAITALPEPFAGQSPVESFEVMLDDGTTREYSGTVAWTETDIPGATFTNFDGSKAYTATMTLSAEAGYQFAAGTSFAVTGADTVATTIGDHGLTATVTATYAVKDRYVITEQGVITAYSGPGGELVVPGTIDGKSVLGFGLFVFENNASLTRVALPDTIKSMGDASFKSCTSLRSINIPTALTEIPDGCFSDCTSLETVTIPSGAVLTAIGSSAFKKTKISSLTLPAKVTTIKNWAFWECGQLTSVTMPADSVLETIGEKAFYACNTLTAMALPKSLKTLGKNAFENCDHLATLTFESGSLLETISEKAFDDCRALTTLALPATVTAIGDFAFSGCTSLATLSFAADSQLVTIGEKAFASCALTTLSLPATVTTIGNNAFAGNKLTQLTFNNAAGSALSIGPDAFMGSEEWGGNLITKITLPGGVTIPDSSQTGFATMGLYGAAFKSFYESTGTDGNNSAGGTFIFDLGTQQWSKNP